MLFTIYDFYTSFLGSLQAEPSKSMRVNHYCQMCKKIIVVKMGFNPSGAAVLDVNSNRLQKFDYLDLFFFLS